MKKLFLKTNLKLTKCVFRSCNVWKLSKGLNMFLLLRITVMCTSWFIATSLQLLLPVIQKYFFSVPRFSIRRKKNPQKLNVIFLDHNCRYFTLQKLPVIRYSNLILLKLQYTPSVSTIILSGRTYSFLNVWLTLEKCPTNLRVNTLQVRLFGRTSW